MRDDIRDYGEMGKLNEVSYDDGNDIEELDEMDVLLYKYMPKYAEQLFKDLENRMNDNDSKKGE